jgi:hypothetical protein
MEYKNVEEDIKQNLPWWRVVLNWMPKIVLTGGIVLLLMVQDPCGCGLANHYRISKQESLIMVEIARNAGDQLDTELLTDDIQRQIQTFSSEDDISVRFALMPEYGEGFRRTELFTFSTHRRMALAQIAVLTGEALAAYHSLTSL